MLDNLIPQQFYMTDLGKAAYLVLYLPLVLGLALWFYRKVKAAWPLLAVMALVLLTLPFWDVYMIGRDADRLCREQGGLHVYKTVEANSFRGGANIVNLSKYGFEYAESYGVGGQIFRRKVINGKLNREVVEEFTTRYEIGGRGYQVITESIASNAIRTVDLETGEVLGEAVTLNIHPGRFDGIFLELVGSGPVVWHCGARGFDGEELSFDDLAKATIKPLK